MEFHQRIFLLQAEKKAKTNGSDLYRAPTNQELNQLKETENLFQSSLFRLKVE